MVLWAQNPGPDFWVSNTLSMENSKLQSTEHAFFDSYDNTLYFSFDQHRITPKNESYSLHIEIKKKSVEQDKLKPLLSKVLSPNPQEDYPMDSMDISKLYSGNFDVLLLVKKNQRLIYKSNVLIQVFHPQASKFKSEYLEAVANANTAPDSGIAFVQQYSLKQLKLNIAALMPLARGSGELTFIKGVDQNNDLSVLQQFFVNFWSNRDAGNPEKAWRAYADKLNFVAKTYGNAQEKGYESDRGRIYIVYGQPDRIDRALQEKNARPYEIWFYYNANGRNNVKFLFVQPGMMSNQFILLHSTESDEIVNPNWRSGLFLTNPSNDKENRTKHRVFQYFQ